MIYSSFFVHNNKGDFMNVLLTGATSGIGYHLALKLIKKGNMVYLCVHNDNEIKTVIEKTKNLNYQDRISVIKLDITNKKDREKITKLDIDCLVNLSAIGIGGSLINMDVSSIRKNFDVNFFSALELIKLYMETRKNKKGKVVVTSSIAGLMPISFLGSYCSSKAALSTFITCLKKEINISKLDIDIKLIEPGTYKTGFNQIMIDSKNELDSSLFNNTMIKTSKMQSKIFSIIEYKKLNSIVNKMYNAIESKSNKLTYRAPLLQIIVLKLYLLFVK